MKGTDFFAQGFRDRNKTDGLVNGSVLSGNERMQRNENGPR